MTRTRSRHLDVSRRAGMVLFIVVVITALVSVAALGFLFSMRTENLAAHLQADQMQVDQIAQSGVEYLQELAAMPQESRTELGGMSDNPAMFRDMRVDLDLITNRHGRFCVLRPSYAEDSDVPVFHFGVQNESSKLNLAQLPLWDKQYPDHARRALMNLPGMTEEVADAILDWIDGDDQPRDFGAEAEFYLGLDPPRQPPNRVPDRIEDLLAVRGVTARQLIGRQDARFPLAVASETQAPANESTAHDSSVSLGSAGDARFVPAPPWSYFLTVCSAERNESGNGQPRINLNRSDLALLYRELLEAFDQETANYVVALRRYGPSSSSLQSARAEPVPTIANSDSAQFELPSPLDVVDSVAEVPSPTESNGDESTAYRSPFVTLDRGSLQQLVRFLDRTTTDTIARFAGRVDVRTAPRPVLLGIPGLEPDQVDRILSARQQQVSDSNARSHAAWLLAEGIVDLDTMKRIDPFVTVGGDVWRAQVVAFYDVRSPWMRHEIIVDGTRDETATIYYKDLRRLGQGFRYVDLVLPESVDEVNPPRSITANHRSTRSQGR